MIGEPPSALDGDTLTDDFFPDRKWTERFVEKVAHDARSGDPVLSDHLDEIEEWVRLVHQWRLEDDERMRVMKLIEESTIEWALASRRRDELREAAERDVQTEVRK